MTKYLDSAPFLIPAPAKEFRPEKPTNLYADKFPDLVDKPEPEKPVMEWVELNGIKQCVFIDPTMPKDQVKLVSAYPPSVVTLVNVGLPEKEEEES